MSGLLDILFPPWARDVVVGPGWRIIAAEYEALFHAAGKLFGSGEPPRQLPPPPPPAPPPSTGGSGPAQEEIDKLSEQILQLQQQIEAMHTAAGQAADQSATNSQEGNQTNSGLLSDQLAQEALAPQGTSPDAQAAALAAMQQQIDALTQNVQDKATNATGIADALRNLGTAMPSMGMPSMGMPGGGGLPLGLGGLSGLGGAPAVSPLNAPPPPSVTARPADDTLAPPQVASMAAAEEPRVTAAEPSALVSTPIPAAAAESPLTSVPAAVPAAAKPAPAAAGAAPPAAQGKQITLPSGQVVNAPNAAAADAVRTALSQPAGKGDVATTAYAGTGVDIPTDGAEPGRKIDPADLQPGDIAVFGDHTALVAGNGQLVGSDGKLQPLGVINDSNNFHGFYRPTETADTPAAVTTPATAGVSASTPATATAGANTLMAAPMASPTSNTAPSKPSPGQPASPPPDHVR